MGVAFWILVGMLGTCGAGAVMLATAIRAAVKSARKVADATSLEPASEATPVPRPQPAYVLLDVRERLSKPVVPPKPGEYVKLVFRSEVDNVTHVERMWVRVDDRLGTAGIAAGGELDGEDPFYRGTLGNTPVGIPAAVGDRVVFFLSNVLEVLPATHTDRMH